MKRKTLNIIKLVFIIIVFAFAVLSLVWYIRYTLLFKPLLENTQLKQDKDDHNYYTLRCKDSEPINWATICMRVPSFLSFSGHVTVCQDICIDYEYDDTDYDLTMSYWPKITDNNTIRWQALEYEDDGRLSDKGCVIITDTQLNLIEEYSDSDSHLNYNECKDKMQIYYDEYIKGSFGEDFFD
ncbi:hypothetical protein [Ruminococcus albus]|uniref:Uncharacterized protein n=1 Tax=Ruminococcus albus TaxID=1264 RepID=A0A1I1QQ59_RUMAL|nr:hypothetical protein [Ruminococcus albus]SFD24165.1 hypothetical protein SAMN02910406_03472 [Ruminococcus albus]